MFDRFADKLRERFKKQEDEAPAESPAHPKESPQESPALPEAPAAETSGSSAPEPSPTFMQKLQSGWQKTVDILNTDVTELVPMPGTTEMFNRLKDGLKRTREGLMGNVVDLFRRNRKIDEDFWESLEETLITSDVGVETSTVLVDKLRKVVKEQRITEPSALLDVMREELRAILQGAESGLRMQAEGPTVVMVVGVNGTGKTTSIGKLASRLKAEGKRVMLAAADTFRAAAIDQLQVWADRTEVEIIRLAENADPAAVTYDAVNAAKSRKVDVLLVDTAGRLHNKVNLMEELKKVRRTIDKQLPGAPHETLLVLDATTGQNALQQAKTFGQAVDVTGLVLAKLDGTARGGIVIAIARELGLPVKYIGVGEGIGDLQPFDADEFVAALFATEEPVSPTAES